ncbi:MAG TPA: hypothetical protein VK116_08255, partial [Planctomycetota bacterium]|nr:hypothetical protein [Planctomycetota bacterium]
MSLRRLLRYASIGASILLAGVVLALAWAWWTGNLVRTVYYDADGNRLEGENARVRQVLWSPPTALSPASISPDSADVASRLYGSDRLLVLSERNEHGDRYLYFRVRTET